MAKRAGFCSPCGLPKRKLIIGFVVLWVSILFLAPHMPGNFTSSVFESMDRAARTNALAAVGGKVQPTGEEDQVLKEITSPVLENVEGDSLEQAKKTLAEGTGVGNTLEGQALETSDESKGGQLEEVESRKELMEAKTIEEPAEENTEILQVVEKEPEPVPEETPRGRVRSRLLSARDFNGDRPKGDPVLWDGTIFVGMAAYRDPDCQDTVWSAFSMAANPERVSLGIYQQHADDDPDCLAFQHVICPPQVREDISWSDLFWEIRSAVRRLLLQF